MRISDWSSDVCSSDLGCAAATQEGGAQEAERPPCLAVLPDSRRGEVTKLLPVFAEVVRALAARHPGLSVVIPTVETVEDMVRAQVVGWPVPVTVVRGAEARAQAFRQATAALAARSEEHSSELPSLMRISYAVFCLK